MELNAFEKAFYDRIVSNYVKDEVLDKEGLLSYRSMILGKVSPDNPRHKKIAINSQLKVIDELIKEF